jgi:hypothetical protein
MTTKSLFQPPLFTPDDFNVETDFVIDRREGDCLFFRDEPKALAISPSTETLISHLYGATLAGRPICLQTIYPTAAPPYIHAKVRRASIPSISVTPCGVF